MTDRLTTSRTPDLIEVLRQIMSQIGDQLCVSLPGKIESYDSVTQTADVKPLLSKSIVDKDGNEEKVEIPVISKVPVAFSRGGGHFMSFPLEKGDNVFLIFCDRSIDDFWFSDGSSPMDQIDFRTHDLSDAVAIPAFYPSSKSITDLIGNDGVFGKEKGTQVRSKGDTIEVTTKGLASAIGGFVAMAQKVDLIISVLDTVFRTAWVPVPNDGGAALKTAYLAAFSTPPSSVASTNLKAD
jgi:hypothetical protein